MGYGQSIIAALTFAGMLCVTCDDIACSADRSTGRSASDKTPSQVKLQGEINQLVMLCGASGISISGPKLPADVTNVRLGSTASYAGIRKGDRILGGKVDKNVFTLAVERSNGQRFEARLATDAASLKSLIATASPQMPNTAKAESDRLETPVLVNDPLVKVLTEYNFTLVVDHSGSMNAGAGSDSRLQWVKNEIGDFCKFLEQQNTNANVIVFNEQYQVHRNCSSRDLQEIVSDLIAFGGTNLSAALREAIEIAEERRPTMIVVITDGVPNLGPSVQELVVKTANALKKKGDVVICFVEVGQDAIGEQTIRELDQDLLRQGAQLDIVDAKYYPELQRVGLQRALAEALLSARSRQ